MKNFNDSEVAMGILEKSGQTIVDSPDEADVIVINTCGFINDAKRESIAEIFEMSKYKSQGKKIIVSGCLSQRYGEELYDDMPEVDGFLGVNDYENLPELLKSFFTDNEDRFIALSPSAAGNESDIFLYEKARKLTDTPYTATLKVAEGCNNRCAYCAIPSIRGNYRSRKKESIVQEAKRLAASGCKELVLIAQDVTCYGIDIYGKYALADLLRELCAVEDIEWIRLMYCYEDRITDELIDVIASENKICKYIDIPIQHISDKILKAMNRRSTSASIRETLRKLRERVPGINIRTTLIVGFPGETEEDYNELFDFVANECFERLGVFAYSKEEGTPAANMEDQIPDDIKQDRLDGIMRRQIEISRMHNMDMIGEKLEVLVEDQDEDGSFIGRSRYDAPDIDGQVLFTGNKPHEPGDIVKVEVLDAFDYDLEGREVG